MCQLVVHGYWLMISVFEYLGSDFCNGCLLLVKWILLFFVSGGKPCVIMVLFLHKDRFFFGIQGSADMIALNLCIEPEHFSRQGLNDFLEFKI